MADRYEIEFTQQAYGHLQAIRRFDRNAILDAVKEQLTYTRLMKRRRIASC